MVRIAFKIFRVSSLTNSTQLATVKENEIFIVEDESKIYYKKNWRS